MFQLDFVSLLLSFKSSLCILVIVFHQMSFASIFLQFVACLLILLILSFEEQKVLILMKSSQSIVFFMVCAFCVVLKSHCHIQGQLGFLLYSRSFIILHFTFRCEICTDLIFVRGVSSVSRLIFYFFWHVCVQMQRTDSFEKTLMLGKIERRRRRG